MSTSNLGGKVTPKHTDVMESERAIVEQQDDDELQRANARRANAEAADQEKLTELKESYAGAVLFFMWMWFGAVILVTLAYFNFQIHLSKEIPKEVMISIFTCTAVVMGLVGYILKGLFGSK